MQRIVKKIVGLSAFFFLVNYAASPHVVMLSFLSYPTVTDNTYEHKIQGIPVTYFGNSTVSNHIGLATFWYHGEKSLIYILVCNEVEPVMLYNNTVDYFKVSNTAFKDTKYSFYVLEKKYDHELKLYFWDVQKVSMQAARIPLNTIVIHVSPEEVEVPTGVVVSSSALQLVLPTIYVKEINLADNVFRFARISQFFARMNQTYDITKDDLKIRP